MNSQEEVQAKILPNKNRDDHKNLFTMIFVLIETF
jgi:hypothetical protein